MSRITVPMVSLVLLICACDAEVTEPGERLAPSFMEIAGDGLPILDEAESQNFETLAKITDWGVDPSVSSTMGGNAHFNYWIQATNPLGFTFPALRQNYHAEAFNPQMFWSGSDPGDFVVTVTGFDWNDVILPWGCDEHADLKIEVRTTHTARWQYYFQVPQIPLVDKVLRTPDRVKQANGEAECDTAPAGELVQGSTEPGEDSGTICQQWFWYVDGVVVDEWWECYPIET